MTDDKRERELLQRIIDRYAAMSDWHSYDDLEAAIMEAQEMVTPSPNPVAWVCPGIEIESGAYSGCGGGDDCPVCCGVRGWAEGARRMVEHLGKTR